MVLFTAGVQKIPQSLYDAARVDGAGAVREFFAVTLPAPARRDRGRADADHDRRAAQLRPRLHHDQGRPGRRDVGAGVPGLRPRVQDAARSARPRRSASASPRSSSCCRCLINRIGEPRARDDPPPRPDADLRDPRRLLADRAAADRRDPARPRCRTRAACAASASFDGLHLGNFGDAWDAGPLRQRTCSSSTIVAVAVVVVVAVLSILAGYAFGLMRFRGAEVLFYVLPARADGADGGDDRPALLRPARPQPDRHLLGADPAADRHLGRVRHVLDARVLPLASRAR